MQTDLVQIRSPKTTKSIEKSCGQHQSNIKQVLQPVKGQKELHRALKHPFPLLSSKPAERVLGLPGPGPSTAVGEGGGQALLSVTNPGSGESQRYDSRVRGTFGGRYCNMLSAREKQPGCLQGGNKIMGGKEHVCQHQNDQVAFSPAKGCSLQSTLRYQMWGGKSLKAVKEQNNMEQNQTKALAKGTETEKLMGILQADGNPLTGGWCSR